MPHDNKSELAIAVPKDAGVVITSLYALMLEWMAINFYNICLACLFAYRLKKHRATSQVTSVWNKRWSLTDSMLDLYLSIKKQHWKGWTLYVGILVLLGVLVFQIALSILVPQMLLLDTAAPVNPARVVIFDQPGEETSDNVRQFQLKVPAALRAASVARVAPAKLWEKVKVTNPEDLGETEEGEKIQQIKYGYTIWGTDLGLQNATSLLLSVTGACTTEYGWLVNSSESSGVDTYQLFNNPDFEMEFSSSDSQVPLAFFQINNAENDPAQRNISWAMIVNSVGRFSYSEGTDPLYRTGPARNTTPPYKVLPKRPILSCWESDTWSYKGQDGSVYGLSNTDKELSKLFLPEPLSDLLILEHLVPRIVTIGTQLTYSALQSSVATIGGIFDAESSSFFEDFRQLVRATYIATANTLGESTLHPPMDDAGRSGGQRNIAANEDNKPRDGAGKFVIFTPDVATLSVTALAVIPTLAVVIYALKTYLLAKPLKVVNALDAGVLHDTIISTHPEARPTAKSMDSWALHGKRDREEKAQEALLEPKGKDGGAVRVESRPVSTAV